MVAQSFPMVARKDNQGVVEDPLIVEIADKLSQRQIRVGHFAIIGEVLYTGCQRVAEDRREGGDQNSGSTGTRGSSGHPSTERILDDLVCPSFQRRKILKMDPVDNHHHRHRIPERDRSVHPRG